MIELKQKPKEPRGREYIESINIELFPPMEKVVYDDGEEDYEDVPNPSLAEVVKYFTDRGVDISKVYPRSSDDYWGHEFCFYSHPSFDYTVYEPQKDYDKRVKQYEKDLKEYKEWYKENKEAIKATKQEMKRLKGIEMAKKKLESKKKRLKKQQEKIKVELEGLK